ncbi:MAG: hypothetical protein HRT89_17750 [Lentisphaeria bacterium]|nr:hypothetical protein [Lentisphaeria bacterium]NQZ69902.1 hypothetical protein [Lentisphaeria bacterium]
MRNQTAMKKRPFTKVEMLMTLLIIIIFAGIVIVLVKQVKKRANKKKAEIAKIIAEKKAAKKLKLKLQAFEYDIQKESYERAIAELSAAEIAKEVNIELPVFPPLNKKKDVENMLKYEILDEVNKSYPMSRFDEMAKEVKQKNRLYKLNERVTVRVKDVRRGGQYKTVKGYLRTRTKTWIRVGDVKYNKALIDPNQLVHFDTARHMQKVRKEKKRLGSLFEKQRKKKRRVTTKKLSPIVWDREGYTKVADEWVSKESVFKQAMAKALAKNIARIRAEIESVIYEKAGFCWNKEFQRWEDCGK